MKARRAIFIHLKEIVLYPAYWNVFCSQRNFFNKVAGTAHVHPLKLNIYTLAQISFKPFAFAKLNVTCNYQKSLIFNGRLRETRNGFLIKELLQFLFLVCFNPKACLKLEANKTQTFIAPYFSSLYRG